MSAALLRPKPIYVANDLPTDGQGRLIIDLYARMSDGFDGKELNVEGQFKAAESYVLNRGAVVGERISDPLSAWKADVKRPGWDFLVERMRTRQSAGASFWNIDRFLRQNRQLEGLLDTVDQMGCVIYDSSGERRLDNEDDRFILRMMVSQANKSSADTSRRVKSKYALLRGEGILIESGPRAFAWPGMEPKKPGQKRRREVSPERLKAEREALKWAFEHVAGGGKLAAVARKWNEAELLSYYGTPWSVKTVGQTMSKQRYAGRIEHGEKLRGGRRATPEVVGEIADHKPTIDPDLFDRVQNIFNSRKLGRPQGQKSIGTGLVPCSLCGTALVSRPRYVRPGGVTIPVPTYRCIKPKGCGGVQIDQVWVDNYLRKVVIQRLSDPTVADQVTSIKAGQNADIDQVSAELETAREAERGLAARRKARRISLDVFLDMQEDVFNDIERLEARLAELKAASTDLEAVQAQSQLEVAQEWDARLFAGDVEGLREMVRSALSLVRVVVLPGWRYDDKGEKLRVDPTERMDIRPLGIGTTTRGAGFDAASNG